MSADSAASSLEQSVMFGIGGAGIACNCLLAAAVLCQRHNRRSSAAFILHSCAINCVLACLSILFGRGLQPESLSASGCNRLGTTYVLLMTTSVFNLVAVTCCEVYVFDNSSQALKRTPRGSFCCVLFALVLVYTGSVILHLGPTLIGANFERTVDLRCLLVYGQTKNYIVYTMWILIVSMALAAACYYLVIFYRVIDKTVEAKLIIISSRQDEIAVELAAVEANLDKLAEMKHNRQRVLAIACGLHVACWYPLFFLLLADPGFGASPNVYRALTLLGFLKCALEPLALLLFDSGINHWLVSRVPCGGESVTESQVNRWLRQLEPSEADTKQQRQAQQQNSNVGNFGDNREEDEEEEEEVLSEEEPELVEWRRPDVPAMVGQSLRFDGRRQQQRRLQRQDSPITLV